MHSLCTLPWAQAGVAKERVLIKTPATWAGIRATERLEREGIKCLVTLVCSQVQGRAAAEAGASIIATCEPSNTKCNIVSEFDGECS